jgi:predicted DNA-binding protein
MRRLQMLVRPDQFERLRARSEKTGAPIGEVIRRAIDAYLKADAKRATRQ